MSVDDPTETSRDTDEFLSLSQLLKAAGDELRLEILRALAQDSFGVLELCHIFATKQSGMSHHLKVMAGAALVSTRKEGNSIFYRRASLDSQDPHSDIRRALLQRVDAIELGAAIQRRLQEIHQQRAEASQQFFAENTERFREQQDLIAAFDVYGPHVADTLEKSSPPGWKSAIEIGPGAGEFIDTLSAHFQHVTALDNSREMLTRVRQHCEDKGLNNIDFVHNDTRYCVEIPESLDCAVINMVLHHSASPQQIFADVATALKPGGVMIICDLREHNQDWVRENCGDLWLGFSPEDLDAWARSNALQAGQSSYLALRNGFQIQVKEFIKHKWPDDQNSGDQ